MKALILAAGRGERMRPLTDTCPKPLIKVRNRALIDWHLMGLARAGVTEIFINHAYLGELIETHCGTGDRFGLTITYSAEHEALETAGAVALLREQLGKAPFAMIAADVFCPQFNYADLFECLPDIDPWGAPLKNPDLAWLYLVRNPAHHLSGDFVIEQFSLKNQGAPRHTFSGIGVYRPEFFDSVRSGDKVALAPLLRIAADQNRLGGELYRGPWFDIGTPERLAQANQMST